MFWRRGDTPGSGNPLRICDHVSIRSFRIDIVLLQPEALLVGIFNVLASVKTSVVAAVMGTGRRILRREFLEESPVTDGYQCSRHQ